MNSSNESILRIPKLDCVVTATCGLGGTSSPVVHLLKVSQKRSIGHDGAHIINDDGGSPIYLPHAKRSFQPQPVHLIANRDHELPGIIDPSTINESTCKLKKSLELHKRRHTYSVDKKSSDANFRTQRKSIREASDIALWTQKIIDQEKEINDLKLQVEESRKETDHVIQMTANVAHDLKSPLNTLMLGERFNLNDLFNGPLS